MAELHLSRLLETPGGVWLVWDCGPDEGAIGAPSAGEAVRLLRERFGARAVAAATARLLAEVQAWSA